MEPLPWVTVSRGFREWKGLQPQYLRVGTKSPNCRKREAFTTKGLIERRNEFILFKVVKDKRRKPCWDPEIRKRRFRKRRRASYRLLSHKITTHLTHKRCRQACINPQTVQRTDAYLFKRNLLKIINRSRKHAAFKHNLKHPQFVLSY